MGNSFSASEQGGKKLTLVKSEALGVIKISDAVVERLQEELVKPKEQEQEPSETRASGLGAEPSEEFSKKSSKNKIPSYSNESQLQTEDPPVSVALEEEIPSSPPVVPHAPQMTPPHEPGLVYADEMTSLSALKVKEQKEKELRQIETYYQDRINKMRNEMLTTKSVKEENIKASIAAIDRLFLKARQASICQENRHAIIKCYQKNSSQPLLCNGEVEAFSKCVESARFGQMSRNG